jgi:transcriptional regulator NrdR family protein
MHCPRCKSNDDTRVVNTVHRLDGSVRRRHECSACRIRWTGYEKIAAGSIQAAAAQP